MSELTHDQIQSLVDAGTPLICGDGEPLLRIDVFSEPDGEKRAEVWLCDGEHIEIEAKAKDSFG